MTSSHPDWFCNACGHRNQGNWNACQMCRAANPNMASFAPNTPKSSNTKVIGIGFLALILLCGMCGFFGIITDNNKIKNSSFSQVTPTPATLSVDRSPTTSLTPYPKGYTVDGKNDSPPKPELEVLKSTWVKDGFGTVAVWRVTFRNNSDKRIGDIKYETRYFSESGNQVDRGGELGLADHTIQKVIEPKKTRTLEVNDGFTHSEAHTANFTLKSWRALD
jgi:hypothetical protein